MSAAAAVPREGSSDISSESSGVAVDPQEERQEEREPAWEDWCLEKLRCTGSRSLLAEESSAHSFRRLLEQEGYFHQSELKEAFPTRAAWLEFAKDARLPHRIAHQCASEFGPNLPSYTPGMDRQDWLKAQLCELFGGDFDNKDAFQDGPSREPRELFKFLVHDTSRQNGERILEDGILRASCADDTHYDGKLSQGTAPKVAFFQASPCGCDGSIYPRSYTGQKLRLCMPPAQIALHTDTFKMYYVSITPPRQYEKKQGKMLQLHLLFIRGTHPQIPFCDKNFLLVNKVNFQPFQYSNKNKEWHGYGEKTSRAFGGLGVKINVAIAEDVPIWYKESSNMREVFVQGYGVVSPPPYSQEHQSPKKGCHEFVKKGHCSRHAGNSCSFFHWDDPSGRGINGAVAGLVAPRGSLDQRQVLRDYMEKAGLAEIQAIRNLKREAGICFNNWPRHIISLIHAQKVVSQLCAMVGVAMSGHPRVNDIGLPTLQVLATLSSGEEVGLLCDAINAVNGSP